MMSKSIIKHGWLLGAFALATSGLIAMTHYLTKDRIAEQERATLLATLNKIIPIDSYNNELSTDCVLVSHPLLTNKNPVQLYRARLDGNPVALATEVISPDGYNGNIKMLVALLGNDTIGGIRVLSHKETPGLGDKIEERVNPWITQFGNIPANNVYESIWAVKKDGGQFDQFTGATITPRAVLSGMKNAVSYMQQEWESAFTDVDATHTGNHEPRPQCGASS